MEEKNRFHLSLHSKATVHKACTFPWFLAHNNYIQMPNVKSIFASQCFYICNNPFIPFISLSLLSFTFSLNQRKK